MSNTVIQVENISKKYQLGSIGTGSLSRDLNSWWANIRGKEDPNRRIGNHDGLSGEHWALRDVSFDIKQGEAVGIIGKNGAGKSTLLKILSRVTTPTGGHIRVKGRIASLLEVGTGFHPDLSGRENIFLNGAILGMNKAEIKAKFDEIVYFSGVEKYINTPVKRYSSGMYVRLAFAVAAHLEPEILIVDEVLAVGDAAFQRKCIGKMNEVSGEGRTVLFVSHQMDMIRSLCSRCIMLNQGVVHLDGSSESVIEEYNSSASANIGTAHFQVDEDASMVIQVVRGRILNEDGKVKTIFDVFEKCIIELEFVVRKEIEGHIVNIELKKDNQTLFVSFDTDTNVNTLISRSPGRYTAIINLPSPLLKAGSYHISVGTGIANIARIQHLENILSFEVDLLSKSGSVLSLDKKRAGIIATYLPWYVNKYTEEVVIKYPKI